MSAYQNQTMREISALAASAVDQDLTLPGAYDPPSMIGMSTADIRRYSIAAAMRQLVDDKWKEKDFNSLERECHEEIVKRRGKSTRLSGSFNVPFEIQTRANTVASGPGGGYLVATQNLSYIDLLRNRAVAFRMGAKLLTGLKGGGVQIPKLTAGVSGGFLNTETSQFSEQDQTFSQLSFTSGRSCGGYTEISRQLLMQSGAEGFVIGDLAAASAVGLDLGIIAGSGTAGTPLGIIRTPGVQTLTVTPGPSFAFTDVNALQTNAIAANSDGSTFGIVTTGAIAKKWKETQQFSGSSTSLWTGSLFDSTDVCGERGMTSTQVPAGTVIAGNWGDIIVAQWGDLEIAVDPFTKFKNALIGVRCFLTCDFGIRYPQVWTVNTGVS